jgi:hypothetical protein
MYTKLAATLVGTFLVLNALAQPTRADLDAAAEGLLPVVPYESLPQQGGTFWSWKHGTPYPFNYQPDPFNSFKFWTVLQYADPTGADADGSYAWRTVICLIMPWL